MTSSPLHRDFSMESSSSTGNVVGNSGTRAPGSGNGSVLGTSASTDSPSSSQQPSSSSSNALLVDEESPLLVLNATESTAVPSSSETTTSPIPDLLDALQNRNHSPQNTAANSSPLAGSHDRIHVAKLHFTSPTSGGASLGSLSIPEPFDMAESRRSYSEGSILSSSFLTPQNLQPTAPSVYEPRHSRRRLSSRHSRRSGRGGGAASSTANTSTTTTSSTIRRSPPSSNQNSNDADEEGRTRQRRRSSSNNSLRASLDAGMAAVQRWIRSRSGSVGSEPSLSSGRSVTWSNQRESLSEIVSLSSRSAGMGHGNITNNPDEESYTGHRSLSHVVNNHPTTIFEEDEDALGRQRALSESDAVRIREFFRSMGARRRRGGNGRGRSTENARQLSSSAAAALYTTTNSSTDASATAQAQQQAPTPPDFLFAPSRTHSSLRERSVTDGGLDSVRHMQPFETSGPPAAVGETSSVSSGHSDGTGGESERRARARWIQINRRFQFVITAVALLFSLLLFAILICWVVLTSAYVVSFDKSCDVPLKPYFWLVTFQLVLDVFRTDIMRFVFNWDSSSNQSIPTRVIIYNVTYLLYASLILRLGIKSVFVDTDADCRDAAPELFNASIAFVSLSLAAWATIICGYLLPFFVVAALLTCNGYNPSAAAQQSAAGATQPVFPAAYATTGAPPGTIDLLHVLRTEDFPDEYPRECCICMEPFGPKTVVETSCKHVFHKQCCREWLRQARSCPVCRMDIPSACQNSGHASNANDAASADGRAANASGSAENPPEASRIPLGPTGRPVVGLWRALRSQPSGSDGGRGEGE